MKSQNNNRTFFVLYSNGDTFYFLVNVAKGEISCVEFQKMYQRTMHQNMPAASELVIANDNLYLKNAEGKIIYSLEVFKKTASNFKDVYLRPGSENATIEKIYMDEDIRATLLGLELIKYGAESSNIPGLLYEPVEETHGYTKTRRK